MQRFDPRTPRRWAFLVLATIAMALAACTGQSSANTVTANVVQALSAPDADEYARVTEPVAFSFRATTVHTLTIAPSGGTTRAIWWMRRASITDTN
ncbi:MAG: hypothetical protein IPK16_32545 [Anaerolineales bacterium]|nr:hypothetical protein [Anaerolineales bacterium]